MNAPVPFTVSAGGSRVLTTVFIASGVYQPSPGLVSLIVECVGGGGGGGGVSGDAATAEGGGGGGSGGYSRTTLQRNLVLGGVVVTIGDGGVPEGDGGTTTFGALCVANGGGHGSPNASANAAWGQPGYGAAAGIGDVTLPGNPGSPGTSMAQNAADLSTSLVAGGMGGAIMGGGGPTWLIAPGNVNVGAGANGPGGGGGGAFQNQVVGSAAGGPGASGICIVTEFCAAETGGGDECNPCWPNTPPNVCWPGGWWRDDC